MTITVPSGFALTALAARASTTMRCRRLDGLAILGQQAAIERQMFGRAIF